jgi:hypothetical protein
MDFDPNGYLESASSKKTAPPVAVAVAVDCKHFMQSSDFPAPNTEDPDWEDAFKPTSFVSVPVAPLLCKTCENAIRTELRDAEVTYLKFCANRSDNDDLPLIDARIAASKRYTRASIKVANFEGRTADRKSEVKKAREQMWEAGKKVNFAVEEGKGAGEKPKEKKKVSAIAVGWIEPDQPASTSTQQADDSSYVFKFRPTASLFKCCSGKK